MQYTLIDQTWKSTVWICGYICDNPILADEAVTLKYHKSSQDLRYPMLHMSKFRAKRNYFLQRNAYPAISFDQAPLIGHSRVEKGKHKRKKTKWKSPVIV